MGDVLAELRSSIDKVDKKLVELIAERFELTEKVGLYKLHSAQAVLQSNRWDEVLDNLREQAKVYSLSTEMLEHIWNAIHAESLQQQLKIQEDAKRP